MKAATQSSHRPSSPGDDERRERRQSEDDLRERRRDSDERAADDSNRRRRSGDSYADDREDESERRSRRWDGDEWSDRRRRRDDDDGDQRSSRDGRQWRRGGSSSSSSSSSHRASDPIRFLSSVRLEQPVLSSSRAPAASAFVLLRSLPSSCDEAALHSFCLPFHCRSHRFLPPASPPSSTRDCLIEFSDTSWASQFVSIFKGKAMLRATGHALPVEMDFILSREAADMQGKKRRRDEAGAEREREDGEVKEENEQLLAPSLRRARLRAEYDFSSLSALTGSLSSTQHSSSVLVVSQLPAAFSVTSSALSDVVRYAFAPFAAVRFVHLQRLEDSGAVVALVVLHSEREAKAVMQKKDDIRVMKEQVDLHFAHKKQAAQLAQQPDHWAAAAQPLPSTGPSLLSSLLSSVSSAAINGAAVRPAHLPPSYVYQQETGFWTDSASTLSFHPSTGLYYDSSAALYYVWNAATQQYAAVQPPTQNAAIPAAADAPAPTAATAAPAASSVTSDASFATSSLPPQTASVSVPIRLSLSTSSMRLAPTIRAARPALFAAPEETAAAQQPAEASQTLPHDAAAAAATASSCASALTAAGGVISSSSSTASADDLLSSPLFEVSAVRIACLLCQRGFASVEQLRRHVERSQLHATNLQQQQQGQAQAAVDQPQQPHAFSAGHKQLQPSNDGAAGKEHAATPAAVQAGSLQPAESAGADVALPAAARYYLSLLEQSRQQLSEQSEHRRPLLK